MSLKLPSARLWPLVVLLAAGVACTRKDPPEKAKGQEVRDPVTGLTTAEASEVLARVGDRSITLGEYAASLARMDRFERLRYQSADRQQELLDEMIKVEVLAQEARKRGLASDPDVQLRTMQALRDELLQDLKRSLPKPEELSEREVRAYYSAHENELRSQRRHRVLVIVVGAPRLSKQVAAEPRTHLGSFGREPSEEVLARSPRSGGGRRAGGLQVTWASSRRRVKRGERMRRYRKRCARPSSACHRIGEVLPEPVLARGKHYVVRLGGISPARKRILTDADGAIRAELLRLKFLAEEKALLARLAGALSRHDRSAGARGASREARHPSHDRGAPRRAHAATSWSSHEASSDDATVPGSWQRDLQQSCAHGSRNFGTRSRFPTPSIRPPCAQKSRACRCRSASLTCAAHRSLGPGLADSAPSGPGCSRRRTGPWRPARSAGRRSARGRAGSSFNAIRIARSCSPRIAAPSTAAFARAAAWWAAAGVLAVWRG